MSNLTKNKQKISTVKTASSQNDETILDEKANMDDQFKMEMDNYYNIDPTTLPDVDKIIETLGKIISKLSEPDMKSMKDDNYQGYLMIMTEEFSEFSETNSGIFQKLVDHEDISFFFTMLDYIKKVKNGELLLENADDMFKQDIGKKYVEPLLKKERK